MMPKSAWRQRRQDHRHANVRGHCCGILRFLRSGWFDRPHKLGQERWIEAFIRPVTTIFHQFFLKIHVHDTLVHLNHTVLRSRRHADFFRLGFQNEFRLDRERNIELEILAQGSERSRDDRA